MTALQTINTPPPVKAGGKRPRNGVWIDKISGRYRPITVHQLAIAWWLYQSKHITRRQLRVYFAAHEMHERRRYTKTDPKQGGRGARKPAYTLEEVKALVGGRGSNSADAALSADVKALGRLGLVKITPTAIDFAVSVDQIAVQDLSGFWAFFDQLPNNKRTVPMPRRVCRALAAGFSSGVTAMMIALMIRSLFWHRPRNAMHRTSFHPNPKNTTEKPCSASETSRDSGASGGGRYRIDGRTKCSWVAEVFGISRRAVTDARAKLIELDWIKPIEVPQWQLNKWGQSYHINVDWSPKDQSQSDPIKGDTQPSGQGESASPRPPIRTESASPCLNTSTPSTKEDLNTRKPDPTGSGPVPPGAGVSFKTRRAKASRKPTPPGQPSLRDIKPEDLRDTHRLLALHDQARERGLVSGSEAGRMDFLSLAERAKAHGSNPARLFAWLLAKKKFAFITQADEDAAAARLRELRDGPRQSSGAVDPLYRSPKPKPTTLTDDDKVVIACVRTAKQHRGVDPFTLAQKIKGWTRDQWLEAHAAYQQKQHDRWE